MEKIGIAGSGRTAVMDRVGFYRTVAMGSVGFSREAAMDRAGFRHTGAMCSAENVREAAMCSALIGCEAAVNRAEKGRAVTMSSATVGTKTRAVHRRYSVRTRDANFFHSANPFKKLIKTKLGITYDFHIPIHPTPFEDNRDI